MKLIFERLQKLFEMPWVEVGGRVIDLELEKLRTKPAIMNKIKSELEKLAPEQREEFIETLFADFWTMMSHYSIFKDEVKALIPVEEPAEIYERKVN